MSNPPGPNHTHCWQPIVNNNNSEITGRECWFCPATELNVSRETTTGDTMTDTLTVEIPADVKGNSRTHVRIQWRNTRAASAEELESARKYAPTFRYTIHEWDDVDKDGTRVTLMRISRADGATVDLFATYYFTRVACATGGCCYSYADHYALVVKDGETTTDGPLPYCEEHLRYIEREGGLTVHRSERLLIGQHD